MNKDELGNQKQSRGFIPDIKKVELKQKALNVTKDTL